MFGPDYFAFGFWKARVALYAILQGLELKDNDEVILPGYTCVVVPNSVRYVGAKPVYADISAANYNIDPKSVERKSTKRTRVLIAQHTYGLPADMNSLRCIAQQQGLFLIEDCAHVLLHSTQSGKALGSFGDAAFFSFQWSKPYTTGLGGMAVTRNIDLANKLASIQKTFQNPSRSKNLQLQVQYSLFRRFFKPQLYWKSQGLLNKLSRLGLFVGSSNAKELTGGRPADFTWKMSPFQHRAGLREMGKIQENSTHREKLTAYYMNALQRHSWPTIETDGLNLNGFRLLRVPVAVKGKGSLLSEAKRSGIEIGSWFESPLHPLRLREHRGLNYELGSCPVAESAAKHTVNLPLHARVDTNAAEKIMSFILAKASPADLSNS